MQCPACRAVYSNGLDLCPRCKTPASDSIPVIKTELSATQDIAPASSDTIDAAKAEQATVGGSTLIEFPGTRATPQWRKQLSERVREIQERRAREAEETMRAPVAPPTIIETNAPSLGLVPQPEVPEMNPIVVAALRRIERARQSQSLPPVTRSRRGGAAAAARIAEEQYQEEMNPSLAPALLAPLVPAEQAAEAKLADAARARNLVVVPPAPQSLKEEIATKAQPRRAVENVLDDEALAQLEADARTESTLEDIYDDRAPVVARLTASSIDLLVVAFASSPFAAVIELTNGNWSDLRVAASMGAIVLVVMFLYLTASTALAGRTWGMSLLSLRAVDADTGLQPTTKQSVARALLYMLSLAAFGLGIIYALFDAEGRTAHDLLSSTAVVQE